VVPSLSTRVNTWSYPFSPAPARNPPILGRRKHDLFGADGFQKMVDRIASIEKSLGIYDLAQFTPRD
jgi:hypothetical protein